MSITEAYFLLVIAISAITIVVCAGIIWRLVAVRKRVTDQKIALQSIQIQMDHFQSDHAFLKKITVEAFRKAPEAVQHALIARLDPRSR